MTTDRKYHSSPVGKAWSGYTLLSKTIFIADLRFHRDFLDWLPGGITGAISRVAPIMSSVRTRVTQSLVETVTSLEKLAARAVTVNRGSVRGNTVALVWKVRFDYSNVQIVLWLGSPLKFGIGEADDP